MEDNVGESSPKKQTHFRTITNFGEPPKGSEDDRQSMNKQKLQSKLSKSMTNPNKYGRSNDSGRNGEKLGKFYSGNSKDLDMADGTPQKLEDTQNFVNIENVHQHIKQEQKDKKKKEEMI